MPQLTFRKKEPLLALGGLFGAVGGLLISVLPAPLSFWVGGLFVVAGLFMMAYGHFGVTSPGRIENEWNAEALHRALRAAPAGSTIRILQTSIPDATKLIGVLEEVLLENKRHCLRLLLLDHEKAAAVLSARVELRVEKAAAHTQEVKSNIDQFSTLKERIDKAWVTSLGGAKLDLEIRLYTFLPFGSVFQIGRQKIFSGLYWNWTASINGPMIIVSDPSSKTWQHFEDQFTKGWDSARQVYPVVAAPAAPAAPKVHG